MDAHTEAIYRQCDECSHVFEIVLTEADPLADGFVPSDWDSEALMWSVQHGNDCTATLIVDRDDLK